MDDPPKRFLTATHMRLLCPFCQKAITVADSEAGQAVRCPECGQTFAAPQLYAPVSTAPPPMVEATSFPVPPPASAPAPVEAAPDLPAPRLPELPAPDRELSGFARMVSVPIQGQAIRYVPAIALFLVLILSFFSWNGLFPGGYSAYTQNAWQGLFGGLSRDAVADDELKLGDDLSNRVRSSFWLLPFLILLLPALALAVAGVAADLFSFKVPPALEKIWPFRPALLAAVTGMMLLALMAQWTSGMGLQRAIAAKVEERHAEKKQLANTPEKLQRWEMTMDAEQGSYHARSTPWLRLTLMLLLLAMLAAGIETGLMLRGNKPPPRVGVMW